ncbi:hypothetical protein D3C78_1422830 [compost metagenome]
MDAPPYSTRRRLRVSRAASSGALSSMETMVGAAKKKLTFSSSTRRQASAASKRRCSTSVEPTCRRGRKLVCSSAVWLSGASDRPTSSRLNCITWCIKALCASLLRWVCSTPLGRPVVPLVYISMQGSASSTATAGAALGCPLASALKRPVAAAGGASCAPSSA